MKLEQSVMEIIEEATIEKLDANTIINTIYQRAYERGYTRGRDDGYEDGYRDAKIGVCLRPELER